MSKVKTAELFEINTSYLNDLFNSSTYPWEIIPKIKERINELLTNPPEGFTFLSEGVLVGNNVKISKLATIVPPAIIGSNTEIRPGA
ncbi:MAG: UDP-N-acetylglucosamine pyrophosphorylase, partial [Clostridia bacterium]|nr:UDP-N-acetylglucosamine pyrophosphorylase [Clostridia bacterium]